jgi:serine/threonine protein kinase
MRQKYIGERFGDYTLLRPLGEGGFASVYLGQEVHKGTPAAVKLPKEQQVHDFINELRRTVLLQHPNIVKILDFGIRTHDNTAFIIMEYAPNGSFRDRFPRGTRVPLDIIVTAVKQVASALQYAHDQRVIHRDVKPENLLLNARNLVLLSDFGIATASLTSMPAYGRQGNVIGTYAYTAPEQLKGRPVPDSDQYSLAIMVYEWLCGALPFEGREYIQWLYLHEREAPPSLREHVPSLAPTIEQVVLKALAKKPEERFDRIETFALALERVVRGEAVPLDPSGPGPAIDTTPFNSAPANPIEQLFQEGVHAQANGKVEEAFRIWRMMMTTSGVPERYSTTARNRVRELRTQMIPVCLNQAREASMQGRWQDEIRLWEDLLALKPSDQELVPLLKSPLTLGQQQFRDLLTTYKFTPGIQERLRIAQQNKQCAWMYINAQQFNQNRDTVAARTQLKILWQDAPYYGDPAALSKDLGLPPALNYEQAIAAEHVRSELERVEREQQEKLAQEQQEQEIATLKRNNRILITVLVGVVVVGIALAAGVLGVVAGVIAAVIGLGIIGATLEGGVVVEGAGYMGAFIATIGVAIAGGGVGAAGGIGGGIQGGVIGAVVGGIIFGLGALLLYGITFGIVLKIQSVISDFIRFGFR